MLENKLTGIIEQKLGSKLKVILICTSYGCWKKHMASNASLFTPTSLRNSVTSYLQNGLSPCDFHLKVKKFRLIIERDRCLANELLSVFRRWVLPTEKMPKGWLRMSTQVGHVKEHENGNRSISDFKLYWAHFATTVMPGLVVCIDEERI